MDVGGVRREWARQVPNRSAKGDVVAVMIGAGVPFVLRPIEGQQGRFKFIGTAYTGDKIMQGESMELLAEGKVFKTTITLAKIQH